MKKGVRDKRFHVKEAIYQLCLLIVGLLLLFPFYWLLSSSLKTNTEIFSRELVWIPETLKFENYLNGWLGIQSITYATFFLNSFKYALLVVTGAIFSNSLVAYAFARINFKFRNGIFMVLLSTLMLPSQVTMIPLYLLWSKMQAIDTYIPLTLGAFLGSAFYIFLFRQFIAGIPADIDEAAVCDGCSHFGIYWRIIMPLSKPVIFTVILFSFLEAYDDFMGPLIYLNTLKKFPVSLALRMFVSNEGGTDWGPIFAMTVVAMIPPILIYIVCQKNLVQGISTTGLKG